MRPLKLLLISRKPPPMGGIAKWTEMLLAWAKGRPDLELHLVDTATRWRAVDDLGKTKRAIGGSVQGVRDAAKVLFALAFARPDVLHLTTTGSLAAVRDVVVLSLAQLFRVPTVYHIRIGRMPEILDGRGLERRFLCRAMRLATRVMAIDRATEAALRREMPAAKVLLVPNAIDLAALAPAGPGSAGEPKTVLFIGWVIPTKGLRELMTAWRSAGQPGWRLVVVGPGNDGFRRELIGLAGSPANLVFAGECSLEQAWAQMRQAEIFVLPTYTEGFPNVILEAMAAARPILATSVGAIPEMLDRDTRAPCGLLIPPQDAAALDQALARLMVEPELRAELGRRARAKVEQAYDTRVVFARYGEIWQALARRGAPAQPPRGGTDGPA